MARGAFQATVTDDAGNVLAGAEIEVRDELTGDLVQVYDAITGGDELGNPFDADENGFFLFYVESGQYRITATSGETEREWRYVPIGAAIPLSGTFTGTLTGISSTVTGTCRYEKYGNIVTLFIPNIGGTSNATSFGLSGIPTEIRPTRIQNLTVPAMTNNGTTETANLYISILTGGTASFLRNNSSSGWTSSGTKAIAEAITVTYILT